MAGAAERLTASRAALLLRCQVAREQRRRNAAMRAARARATALEAVASARAQLAGFEACRLDEMRHAYDALAGCHVDAAALHALSALDTARRAQAVSLAAAVDSMAVRLREADASMAEARHALALAARAVQRCGRLANATAQRHRFVLAQAEEMEREDEASGSWRPVPSAQPAA